MAETIAASCAHDRFEQIFGVGWCPSCGVCLSGEEVSRPRVPPAERKRLRVFCTHEFKELMRERVGHAEERIVNWCTNCGGIVVDREIKGRGLGSPFVSLRMPGETASK